MVNKDKSTVINNKNIIQICCEKPTKKQKQESSNQGSRKQKTSFTKDNEMGSQPFNLVNSFPNSSGLGMDRRARFNQAMQDANSTKSPYSLFDNGSNTFERQGNTEGAEQPVQPTINSDTYFEQPQLQRPAFNPKSIIREPQRMVIDDYSVSSSQKPWLRTRFQDDIDDASQLTDDFEGEPQPDGSSFGSDIPVGGRSRQSDDFSIDTHQDWFSPNITEGDEIADDIPESENEDNSIDDGEDFGVGPGLEDDDEEDEDDTRSNIELNIGPTRFSDNEQPPPIPFKSPYRMIDDEEEVLGEQPTEQKEESYEENRWEKIKEAKAEQKLQEEQRQEQLREEQAKAEAEYKKTEEEKRRNFWIQKDEQLKKDNTILNEYMKLKEKIIAFIDEEKQNSEAENKEKAEGFKPVRGKKASKVKITKTEQPELRAEINTAIKNPEIIIEKKLRDKGIGNTKDASLILLKLTTGAVQLEQKIADRIALKEEEKKEKAKGVYYPTTSNPPITIENIKQAGGAGGAGVQVAGGRGQAGRRK